MGEDKRESGAGASQRAAETSYRKGGGETSQALILTIRSASQGAAETTYRKCGVETSQIKPSPLGLPHKEQY